jgi:inosine-uridine nucleoside N-ribohydrolase
MEKIIIDTDPAIGVPFRDIDDGLAIALALKSPELDVAGLTITHGNVDQNRACRSANRLLGAIGREDVPIYQGALSKSDTAHGRVTEAARFITDSIAASPGGITLVALGPLSNLAAAEKAAPGTLRTARRVVAMGGAVDRRGMMPPFFRAEFNFWKDPPAAAVFVREARDLTLVPFDLTAKVIFGAAQMERLRAAGTEFASWLHACVRGWHAFMSVLLLRGGFQPHDPLAMAYLLHPEWYETETVRLSVIESGVRAGEVVRDPAGATVRVAFNVDAPKFLDFLLERLTAR